jgi:sialate O-acetylesterase
MIRMLMLVVILCAAPLRGDVKLPAIFGDHMVLQAGAKLPIWGTADAGERVVVKAAGQEQSAVADSKGAWHLTLQPIESKDAIEVSISAKNSITLKDVLIGEVWLCSGQSNMGFKLNRAIGGPEAAKAADLPRIRFFSVGRNAVAKPDEQMQGKWEVCSPENAGSFSAVAFFFGRELQKKIDAPIGLMDSSWGGTRAEAWIPKPVFDLLKLPYEPAWTEAWLHPKPDPAAKPPVRERPEQGPGALYDAMIAPLVPYAIRGAVWYQGETNTAYPKEYRDVLAALITSWREAWSQKSVHDFPFLVVQLPNFIGAKRDWATMRESQSHVAKKVPNVGLAVTIDIGESKDVHPKEKLTVGQRLVAVAESLAYGRKVPSSGPTFKSMQVDGATAVVQFDHADGGLVAKGGELLGFQIAGYDGKFIPAQASIDGDKVRVTAASVTSPKMVRYAWENDPKCTLYNGVGFPAAPFRSDARE